MSNCICEMIGGGECSRIDLLEEVFCAAAKRDDASTLRKLMSTHGFDELLPGANNNNSLIIAAANGSRESLETLLNYVTEQGRVDLTNAVNGVTGGTPLMVIGTMAIVHGDEHDEVAGLDCLRLLLKHGANANVPCAGERYPALYHAIRLKHGSEHCNLLLQHTDLGAIEVGIPEDVVYAAAASGKMKILKAFYEFDNDIFRTKSLRLVSEALTRRCLTGAMVDFFVRAGLDVVRKGPGQAGCYWFLCHLVTMSEHSLAFKLRIIEALLRAGAAENADVFVSLKHGCMFFGDAETTEAVAALVWKYGSQTNCNFVAALLRIRGRREDKRALYRLPSLQHSCRLTIRRVILSTGRYPSMHRVRVSRLGLPRLIESYVTFSDGRRLVS